MIPTDFNHSKHTYQKIIEESIKFSGKDLNFFTKIKADFLNQIIKTSFPNAVKLRLLDIGCGHGFIHNYLHQNDYEVVGIDIAEEVLELAKQRNPTVSYLHYDGKTIPFESETFDVAFAICVMHHVPPPNWNNFLTEMKRVLKVGGIAVIFEHNPYNPFTRYIVAHNVIDQDAILLRKSVLEKLFVQSGFNAPISRFILFTPFLMLRWLDKPLGRCPLGAQYYTVATRN